MAGVLAGLNEDGQPVVPQGGNTGLVGGGVPLHGEVVSHSAGWTPSARWTRCRAGHGRRGGDPGRPHVAAAGAGLAFGVDLAARDSATVGGMVATNAGGLRMLRYGGMRAKVAGIEAVLADGQVLSHLAGLTKDNTGYHLGGLLAGSEGTLGVVTRARLRLVPRLPARAVALLGFAGHEPALEALAELRRRLPAAWRRPSSSSPTASRWSRPPRDPAALRRPPARVPARRGGGAHDPTDDLAGAVLEGVGDRARDGAVESDPAGRARLWRYREAHTEAINAAGVPRQAGGRSFQRGAHPRTSPGSVERSWPWPCPAPSPSSSATPLTATCT